ncbi:bifunctional tetrahydrofolate synthase/dihydrofolate synthase [Pseudoalteromonas fenneropenaei]|uniref:Dihydrofolate synthase/folylpolyglutamate synthase n=1 Tax=Pseudoalteromonas fenneropenaei TaxID=1737459 RepID=A0ABV7CMW7_9GAMM
MSQNIPSQSSSLGDWLAYLERIHPKTIDMGLTRVEQVARQIGLLEPFSNIILVAGTNGKGTTARCLEALLLAQGYSVGTYASPHLIRYNERVRINGQEVADQYHVDAFCEIEQGRGDTSLSYFEYGTLGGLAIFKRFAVDYVVLEVGLGGRFDATNIVTPIASVITTIDLDHKEYLGDTRELVGYEKAGIFRTGVPAIVGERNIPHTVTDYGQAISADMVLSGQDFRFIPHEATFEWHYQGLMYQFVNPGIPAQNAATALTVLAKLNLLPELDIISNVLANLKVEGRFQQLSAAPLVYTDVAHNPESARYLAYKLADYANKGFKIHALVAMLADKDKANAIAALTDVVDTWSVACLSGPRGESSGVIAQMLGNVEQHVAGEYSDVTSALKHILPSMDDKTLLIIFGSFFTVAEAIEYWQ